MKNAQRFYCIARAVILPVSVCAVSGYASAASFKVVHDFSNGADGGVPGYTLVLKHGHLYGAASQGGNGYGTVFDLFQKGRKWRLAPIFDFTGDEGQPGWGVTFQKGSIYTNAMYEEVQGGPCGTALQLNKSGTRERQATAMHTFVYKNDGCNSGNLISDPAGNVYGVTQIGGPNGWGAVIELSPAGSGWTETILYGFTGGLDGGAPYSEVLRDAKGNLFGTASACGGGVCNGTVFELSPKKSGWAFSTLHAFSGGADGGQPVAALIMDKTGNLYGAATSGGAKGGGTVFELSPAGGTWNFNVLTSLTGTDGPVAALALDDAGNIYGTNYMDGANGVGSVFKLAPAGNRWKYRDLHDFTGAADGGYPGGGVVVDADGNLFGTAVTGGADGWGVVYEITP